MAGTFKKKLSYCEQSFSIKTIIFMLIKFFANIGIKICKISCCAMRYNIKIMRACCMIEG